MSRPIPVIPDSYSKVLTLLTAIVVGGLLPQLHVLKPLVEYMVMLMLFMSFLDLDFQPRKLQKSLLWVALANVGIAFAGYALLAPFSQIMALTAFITGIAPTAITAPVVIYILKGEVEYVAASVLVTNLQNALVIPLALPYMLGTGVSISVPEILLPVAKVMFIPLILARVISTFLPKVKATFSRARSLSFILWVSSLLIITGNASHFIRTQADLEVTNLAEIATIAFVLCAINFGVGALLGSPNHRKEASQSLGQKNLSFVIWVALTFTNPMVAMGPTFYIIFHHLFNSWRIYRHERGTS